MRNRLPGDTERPQRLTRKSGTQEMRGQPSTKHHQARTNSYRVSLASALLGTAPTTTIWEQSEQLVRHHHAPINFADPTDRADGPAHRGRKRPFGYRKVPRRNGALRSCQTNRAACQRPSPRNAKSATKCATSSPRRKRRPRAFKRSLSGRYNLLITWPSVPFGRLAQKIFSVQSTPRASAFPRMILLSE